MVVRVFIGNKIFSATPWRRSLRSGEACLCSGEVCLCSGEACLRSGVEIFAVAYPKVGKGRRSGVGPYTVADQKAVPQKIYVCYSVA